MLLSAQPPDAERGSATVLVAVTMVALFAAAVMAVDAGQLWTSRRGLITATDAAALAAARARAIGTPGCVTAPALLALNAPGATLADCDEAGNLNDGHVSVRATIEAPVRFGGVLGLGDQSVSSASSAMWGKITAAEGLRPIGLCLDNPHVRSWLANRTPGIVRHILYTKDQPDDCGSGAPGNWGFFDLDGGSNSDLDLRTWIRNGYQGRIGVNDCNADGVPGDPCQADTGSSGNSIADALNTLRLSGEPFPIVIFSKAVRNGATVDYTVYAFLGVIVRDFKVTGAESQRYMALEFTRIVLSGNCCVKTDVDTGVRSIRLCGVDGLNAGPGCDPS